MVAATSYLEHDPNPFERVFTQEYPRAVSVAYRIVGDSDEAEDIAQDVFVTLARRGLGDRANAPAWLYRAIVHTALNAVRARRRRAQREGRDFRLHQPLRDSDEHAIDPQAQSERRYDRELVRAALSRIRTNDARLLALRYSDFSYREISEMLGMNVNHIGTKLARAERALRKELDHETP